jgi:hypothetical protein
MAGAGAGAVSQHHAHTFDFDCELLHQILYAVQIVVLIKISTVFVLILISTVLNFHVEARFLIDEVAHLVTTAMKLADT